jgi:cell division protein FtsL
MATVRVIRNEPAVRRSDQESERSRHLEVVKPGARQRRPFKLTPKTGVTLTGLMFGALFGVAVSHALLIQSQLKLDEMDKDVADAQAEYEQNRLDVAELESPDRIIAAARDLGMVDPAETVWLTPDQTEGAADGQTGATADSGSSTTDGSATGSHDEAESPDTSYAEVKPYLGSTP